MSALPPNVYMLVRRDRIEQNVVRFAGDLFHDLKIVTDPDLIDLPVRQKSVIKPAAVTEAGKICVRRQKRQRTDRPVPSLRCSQAVSDAEGPFAEGLSLPPHGDHLRPVHALQSHLFPLRKQPFGGQRSARLRRKRPIQKEKPSLPHGGQRKKVLRERKVLFRTARLCRTAGFHLRAQGAFC